MANEQPIAPPNWATIVAACRACGLDRDAALRQMRLHWPRRRTGRKPDASITTATAMRDAGEPWGRIYQAAIHGYDQMEPYRQQAAAWNLRHRVKDRQRRRRLKAALGGSQTGTESCTSGGGINSGVSLDT